MVSAEVIGVLALLSLGTVEASVCKLSPSSVSLPGMEPASNFHTSTTRVSLIETTSTAEPSLPASGFSSSLEDVTSTVGSSTTFATFISSSVTLDDTSSSTSTTEVDATSISSKDIQSTTASEDITITATPDTTTTSVQIVESTTTSAATSTAAPPATPPFQLFAYDSQDPILNGGIGYCKLERYQTSQTVFYMKFSPTSVLAPTFTINPTTGAVTVVSGLFNSAGETIGAATLGGVLSTSYLKIVPGAFIDTGLQELVSCGISKDQYNKLLCNWADGETADFWTCGGRLMIVRPGHIVKNDDCPDFPYKLGVHAQFT